MATVELEKITKEIKGLVDRVDDESDDGGNFVAAIEEALEKFESKLSR